MIMRRARRFGMELIQIIPADRTRSGSGEDRTYDEPLRSCADVAERVAGDERQCRPIRGIEHPHICWLYHGGRFDFVSKGAVGRDDAYFVADLDLAEAAEKRVAM